MKFGISDNSCMFVTDSRQESFITNEETAFFMLLSDVPYLTNKLLKSLRIAVLRCMQLVLGGIREASSFLYFINFKFHTQMPRANENLNEGTNVASLSSTPTSAKTVKSNKKLEKGKKSFAGIKKAPMFASFKTKRTNCNRRKNFFISRLFLSKNKTVGLPDAFLLLCNYVRLVTNGRLDSLSCFIALNSSSK